MSGIFNLRRRSRSDQPAWLRNDEHIVRTFRLHWTAWVGGAVPVFLTAAAVAVADLLIEHRLAWIGVLACVVGMIATWGAALNARSTELIVTSERLIFQTGVLGRRRFEVPLDRIFNLDIEQHLLGRLLGFGTLTVQSPSSTMAPLTHLDDPFGAQQVIYHAAEQLQMADAHRRAGSPVPPPPAAIRDRFLATDAPDVESKPMRFDNPAGRRAAAFDDFRHRSPVELDTASDTPLIR